MLFGKTWELCHGEVSRALGAEIKLNVVFFADDQKAVAVTASAVNFENLTRLLGTVSKNKVHKNSHLTFKIRIKTPQKKTKKLPNFTSMTNMQFQVERQTSSF